MKKLSVFLLFIVAISMLPHFVSARGFDSVTTEDVYNRLQSFVMTVDETLNSNNYLGSLGVMVVAVEDLSDWLSQASRYADDPNARLLAGAILSNL